MAQQLVMLDKMMFKNIQLNNKLFFIFCFIVLLFGFSVEWQMFPNDNIIWFLHEANLLLHGVSYNNLFDINPPFTQLFYLPSVLLRFYLTLQHALVLYVFLLLIFSVFLCRFILLRYFQHYSESFVNLFVLVMLIAFIFYPQNSFGEREHVAIILTLPYLFLASMRISALNKPSFLLSILVGLMAGIGFTIKPYFLLTPILVELYIVLKKRNLMAMFRIESILIVLYVLFYFFVILLFFPGYFLKTVPFALNLYRGVGSYVVPFYFFIFNPYVVIFYGALILFALVKRTMKTSELENVLMVAAFAFFLIFIFQRSGFLFYRIIPCEIVSVLLLFLLLMRAADYLTRQVSITKKEGGSPFFAKMIIASIALLLFVSAGLAYQKIEFFLEASHSPKWKQLVEITNKLLAKGKGNKIWQTIPQVSPLNNYVNTLPAVTKSVNTTRYYILWPMRALLRIEKKNKQLSKTTQAEKAWYLKTLLSDLNKSQPYILFSTKLSRHELVKFDKRFRSFLLHYKLYKRLSYVDVEIRKKQS